MENHYIVCGLGNVGHHVVKLLRQFGEKVTVVTLESRAEWLREATELGVEVFQGDARDAQFLEAAGVAKARGVLALTGHDLVNTSIALDVKQRRASMPVVARIFDPELAQQLEASFPLLRALATSGLAAPTFAAAAFGAQVAGSFTLEGNHFVVRRLTIAAESRLFNLHPQEIAERFGLSLLARERKGAESPPGNLQAGEVAMFAALGANWAALGNDPSVAVTASTVPSQPGVFSPVFWTRLLGEMWGGAPAALRFALVVTVLLLLASVGVFNQFMGLSIVDALYFTISTVTTTGYGDITPKDSAAWLKLYACLVMVLGSAAVAVLYSIVTDFLVTSRFKELLGRQRVPPEGQVIVVGLGNMGYRIIEELTAMDVPVVAVDTEADGPFVSAVRARSPVIVGDARLPEVLEKAGVSNARAIITATEDDAVNLGAALAARQANPRARTVVRCADAAFAKKIQTAMKLDAAYSTAAIASPAIVAAALQPGARTAFLPENSLLMIVMRPVGEEWHNRTLAQLRTDLDTAVLLRQRMPGDAWMPAFGNVPLDKQEMVLALVRRKASGPVKPVPKPAA